MLVQPSVVRSAIIRQVLLRANSLDPLAIAADFSAAGTPLPASTEVRGGACITTARTSAASTAPPGPLPLIAVRSFPCSAARRRALGEAMGRPAARGAVVCVDTALSWFWR